VLFGRRSAGMRGSTEAMAGDSVLEFADVHFVAFRNRCGSR